MSQASSAMKYFSENQIKTNLSSDCPIWNLQHFINTHRLKEILKVDIKVSSKGIQNNLSQKF